MADEKINRTGAGTLELEKEHGHDANRDPISGEGGAHPVGTGVGAAGGGTIGAVVGAAVGGPVGAMIGAAVGGLAGGLAGKGVAESVNPTEEDAFWRENYANRNYAQGRTYEDLRPAYQYGWESRTKAQENDWNQAETDLRSGWNQARGTSGLDWNDAQHATRDAWNRVDERHRSSASASAGTLGSRGLGSNFDVTEDDHWRQSFSSRPYASGGTYEDYKPAYQYGWESAHQYRGRRFEEVENDLRSGWERAQGATGRTWDNVKGAVRDAWHRVENALPGDADRDGR